MKSDDVVGRVKTYEAIVKGENIPEPGIPESFKVLLKELQSLALDVRVLTSDMTELQIKESVEEGEGLAVNIEGVEGAPQNPEFIDEDVELTETDLLESESDLEEEALDFDFDDAVVEDLFEDSLDDLDL